MILVAIFLVLFIFIFRFLNKELSKYKDVAQGELEGEDERLYTYGFDEVNEPIREYENYKTKPEYDYNPEELVMKEAPRSVSLKSLDAIEVVDEDPVVGVEILGDSPEDLRRAIVLSEILQRKF